MNKQNIKKGNISGNLYLKSENASQMFFSTNISD